MKTKKAIREARTQDLILELMNFANRPEVSKLQQKTAFLVIDELIQREVITDDVDFVRKTRHLYRWDSLPDKYKGVITP